MLMTILLDVMKHANTMMLNRMMQSDVEEDAAMEKTALRLSRIMQVTR